MPGLNLDQLFSSPRRVVVTAHRGFSSLFPENTLPAFNEAVKAGADLIEFDLRGTCDRVPVILHDPGIDCTSNGSGLVGDYPLKELKRFNFCRRQKKDREEKANIPTFKEALDTIPEMVGLNIQVKEMEAHLLQEICRLFEAYKLHERGYLTLSTFADAKRVKKINDRIEVCILERKKSLDSEVLKQMKDFGCKFLQPHRRDITPRLCRQIKEMGFFASLFYSNTEEDHRKFISYGIQGVITDNPGLLIRTIKDLSLN